MSIISMLHCYEDKMLLLKISSLIGLLGRQSNLATQLTLFLTKKFLTF